MKWHCSACVTRRKSQDRTFHHHGKRDQPAVYHGGRNWSQAPVKKLTRTKLEQMVDDIIQRSIGPCKQAMKDAGVDASKIDEVFWWADRRACRASSK